MKNIYMEKLKRLPWLINYPFNIVEESFNPASKKNQAREQQLTQLHQEINLSLLNPLK